MITVNSVVACLFEEAVFPLEETVCPVEEVVFLPEETVYPLEEAVLPLEVTVCPLEEVVFPLEETVSPLEEVVCLVTVSVARSWAQRFMSKELAKVSTVLEGGSNAEVKKVTVSTVSTFSTSVSTVSTFSTFSVVLEGCPGVTRCSDAEVEVEKARQPGK